MGLSDNGKKQFLIKVLGHEGCHALDYRANPDLAPLEKEFRALDIDYKIARLIGENPSKIEIAKKKYGCCWVIGN